MLARVRRRPGAVLIVNDRVEIARESGAHGVHVGQSDIACREAVRRMPPGAIVGVSVFTPREALAAEKAGATYVGAGAVYPTPSKADARVIGIEALAAVVAAVRVPVVAIGGISPSNLPAGMDARVRGVESVSAGGDVATIAAGLSAATGAVVVATGRVDLIADGRRLHRCSAGHPLMGEVVGTGCMAGSILAAFAALSADRFTAAVCAMQFYGKAGERAAENAGAPMAFKAALIDAVYTAARAV